MTIAIPVGLFPLPVVWPIQTAEERQKMVEIQVPSLASARRRAKGRSAEYSDDAWQGLVPAAAPLQPEGTILYQEVAPKRD